MRPWWRRRRLLALPVGRWVSATSTMSGKGVLRNETNAATGGGTRAPGGLRAYRTPRSRPEAAADGGLRAEERGVRGAGGTERILDGRRRAPGAGPEAPPGAEGRGPRMAGGGGG